MPRLLLRVSMEGQATPINLVKNLLSQSHAIHYTTVYTKRLSIRFISPVNKLLSPLRLRLLHLRLCKMGIYLWRISWFNLSLAPEMIPLPTYHYKSLKLHLKLLPKSMADPKKSKPEKLSHGHVPAFVVGLYFSLSRLCPRASKYFQTVSPQISYRVTKRPTILLIKIKSISV